MFKLYNHQKIALLLLSDNPSFALFMEQGTGKTLPTLNHVLNLTKQNEIRSTLIVAPKATMGAWSRDISLFDAESQERLNNVITVINYDSVWRKEQYYRHWDCIILDESHYIKHRTSQRSKFLIELSESANYRYCLTGTPIGNSQLENIWSQFAFLSPVRKGRYIGSEWLGSWKDFCKNHCVLNQWYRPYRYLRVNELQDIIDEHSYRVTKAECLDLPEKLPDEIFTIEQGNPRIYKQLHKDSAIESLNIIAENPLARMTKMRTLCSGFIRENDGNQHVLKNPKLNVLKNFVEDFNKKLVVFAEFTYSIDEISNMLNKLKIKHVTLQGRTKNKDVWKQFQTDETIRTIVCQSQTANAGIDLYTADTMIFYEMPISSTVHDQCRSRIDRIGQKNRPSYIYFITEKSIEGHIYKALNNHSDFNDRLFSEYIDHYQKGAA